MSKSPRRNRVRERRIVEQIVVDAEPSEARKMDGSHAIALASPAREEAFLEDTYSVDNESCESGGDC